MKYYQGQFNPRNKQKYVGNVNAIYYRSSLELRVFIWCDRNSSITKWTSEEVVIPYKCPIDNNMHRYFVDLLIEFKNNEKMLVEIKPERFTKPPKKGKSDKRYLKETIEYARNMAKWEQASDFAKKNNIEFAVWTEKTIKQLGL
jgi:hypothetical protein